MVTAQNRQGETGNTPFRSGRFFLVENDWYFSTREGFHKGPYSSRHAAQDALEHFIDQCKKLGEIFH